MKRTILGIIGLLFSVVFTLALVTACSGNETDGSEYGTYYHDTGEEEYLLELGEGSKYTLTIAGEEKSGKYTLDGELLTLQEKKGEGLQGSYRGTTIALTYNGTAYTFYKKIEYTVTFESNGGSAVASQKVINGKPATEPAEPEKSGEVFIKWSAEKGLKSRYDFATPVTGDLTLYAQFVALLDPEYTVTFETNGGNTIAAQETVGHAVHELPVPEKAGSEFEGWWVSHYYDANELTYRYEEGMTLGEDTTLYAVWKSDSPAVSVDEKGVKWDSKGNQASYEVKITSPTGGVTSETVQTAEYAFDFTGKEAGRYTVEVTWNGKVGKAFYKNKGLARVSEFHVEGNKLLFNAVENAVSYTVKVVCGTEGHVHGDEPAAAGRSYDFGNCEMPIKFVVKAHAQGYVSSESKEFTYTRQLGTPSLTIDAGKDEVSWTKVENATYYEVKVTAGGSEKTQAVPAGATSFDLKEYASGEVKVTVTAHGYGWSASEAATATYTKARLAAPRNVRLENGTTLAWDEVASADHYVVTVGTTPHETKEAKLSLADAFGASTEVRVSVQAVGASGANVSQPTEELVLKKELTNADVSYQNGTVYWNYAFGVESYTVTVNGENAQTVDENHAAVKLAAKENTIAISYGENKSVSLSVKAFKITFDAQEGDEDVPPIYVADGSELDLPDTTKAGHTFLGWFTAANRSGKLYSEDEAFFTEGSDLNLYAGWRAKQFKIHFNAGVYSDETPGDFDIEYGSDSYTLPVLKSNDNKMAFAGWYTANSLTGGTQYTDFTGKNVIPYMVDNDLTLYAVWAEIYTFRSVTGGYAVSKNTEGIGYVSEITIPSEYSGAPVTTIEDFTNCTTLVTINIPDSITTIQLGTTGAAFAGCSKLANINVLQSDNPRAVYGSHDGVLYFYNQEANGRVELKYYPYARKDVSYTVPASVSFGGTMRDVSVIPEGAFYLSSSSVTVALETLHLPATISLIEGSAFHNFRSLKNVVFEEVGTPAATLDIRDNAFGTSSNDSAQLEEITLPQRLSNATRTSLGNMETLQRVKVVGTGDYTSVDDLLVKTEGRELVFYPRGRTDAVYTIPAGIDAIGEGAFSNAVRGSGTLTGIVIPSHVTKIGNDAFNGSYGYNFKTVTFEKGGQNPLTIGDRAFYGVSLTEIDLPNNLVAIGEHAFGNIGSSIAPITVKVNTDLSTLSTPVEAIDFAWGAFLDDTSEQRSYVETVEIGAKVPTFDISSVFGLALKTVTIDPTNPNFWKDSQNNVIFDGAQEQILYFPRDLTEYTIPTQITRIADSLFANKKELTSVTIHSGVTSIGAQAFRLSGLTTVNFDEGDGADLTIGSLAFSETLVKNVKLPARTKNLGARAFENCTALETVELKEGLTSIGAAVFYGCRELESVTIPASVEEISLVRENQYAYAVFTVFENCPSLTSVKVAEGSKFYQMDEQGLLYRLRDAKTTQNGTVTQVPDELLWCAPYAEGDITVSPYIHKVYVGAFNMVEDITSVTFEDAQETWAADGTSQGKEISIEALTLMNKGVFYGCESLETVVLPEGLKTIAARSLGGDNDLLISPIKSITVPKSVTRIEGGAFYGMPMDTLTFVEGGTEPLILGTDYATSGGYVVYPLMRASAYGDSITLSEIKFPARLKEIKYNAFCAIGSLEKVTFEQGEGAGLTIGEEAFLNCSSLSSFAFPTKLTAIGDSAFNGTALTAVSLPEGLTSIGESAFQDVSVLSGALTIPATVKTIGASAFAGTKIASLTFAQDSVLTSIGDSAFENCGSLAGSVNIPATVETIGSRAFAGARRVNSITFAENTDKKAALRRIGDSAFAQTAITSFTFPTTTATDGIITLGARIFEQCTQLSNVKISPSINSIDNVFTGCSALDFIVVDPANKNFLSKDNEQGILYGKDEDGNQKDILLIYAELDSVVIPDAQQRIAGGSFAGQTKITTVAIPRSITEIGTNAFEGCINLETVTIAANSALTRIGDAAFRNCFKLKSIQLQNATNLQNVGKSVFENCKALTSVTLGQRVTVLGDYMFRDSGLASFTAGAQMVHLGLDTFRGSALESVDLTQATGIRGFATTYSAGSDAVLTTSTENRLFADCKDLTTVKLPATFTQVSAYAFQNCTALTTVEGWGTLKLIGREAFENSGLTSFEIPATWTNDTQIGSNVFAGCKKLKDLTAAQNANLTELWDYFFYECPGLESIDLTNLTALVRLGKITKDWWGEDQARNYTFEGCTSLKNVKLPASVTFLGTYTFSNCTSLEKIDLSNLTGLVGIGSTPSDAFTSTSLSSGTFSGCESLKTVTLPASCTKLAGNTFFGCPVSEMDISKITFFGNYCFSYSGIKSVKLSSAATYGSSVFDHCADLAEITVDADFVGNGLNMVFRSCTSLKTVDLSGSKIKSLNGTFQDCSSLTSVTLPDTLEEVRGYLFMGCSKLQKMDFSKTKVDRFSTDKSTDVGNWSDSNIFQDCTSLTTVLVPEGFTQIGGSAFYNCTSLTKLAHSDADEEAIDLTDVIAVGKWAFMNAGIKKIIYSEKLETVIGYNMVYYGDPVYQYPFMHAGTLETIEFKPTVEGAKNENFELIAGGAILATAEGDAVAMVKNVTATNGHLDMSAASTSDIKLASYAFYGITLTKLTLPTDLTVLPDYAFTGSKIDEVVLPSGLTAISNYAFQGSGIKTIDLKNVKTIGMYAFNLCTELKTVNLANAVELGTGAFQGSGLTSVTIPATLTKVGQWAFKDCDSLTTATLNATLEVPVSQWGDESTLDTFAGCDRLRTVTIGNGVALIGANMFQNTPALTTITLPESVKKIGASAFAGSGITSITVPAACTSIGQRAFAGSKLRTATIKGDLEDLYTVSTWDQSVTYIDWYTFAECSSLTKVVLEGSLPKIGAYMFYKTPALKTVATSASANNTFSLPAGIEEIGNYAFKESGITTVTLGADVKKIGTSAFEACTSLTNVTLAEGLTTIGARAFADDTRISNLTLPKTVESLPANVYVSDYTGNVYTENNAFAGWTASQRITFQTTRYATVSLLGSDWQIGLAAQISYARS